MTTQKMRIASLPMYDWPEVSHSLDYLWHIIQKKLNSSNIPAPQHLTRDAENDEGPISQNVLISQVCGWPYAHIHCNAAESFARLSYEIEDLPPGQYNSVYIGQTKKDIRYLESLDSLLQAGKIAVNSLKSQSGFHVFREIARTNISNVFPEKIFHHSGSHRESIKAVAAGKAKIAAIDTVSFELARKYDPEAVSNISVLGRSLPKPSPPIITSNMHMRLIPALLEAIAYGIYNLPATDRQNLMIKGLEPVKPSDYDVYL